MKEDILDTLRQRDVNLRDAVGQNEAELPQMPADLNARLMQRMEKEKHPRRIWAWVAAAACLLTIIGVGVTMWPRVQQTELAQNVGEATMQPLPAPQGEGVGVGVATVPNAIPHTEDIQTLPRPTATPPLEGRGVAVPTTKRKEQPRMSQPRLSRLSKVVVTEQLLAVNETAPARETAPAEESVAEAPAQPAAETAQATPAKTTPQMLTERDIPITRPENYKYTPEEIALLKQQANEAYLKWVELELEIAKYHLEQTAQK